MSIGIPTILFGAFDRHNFGDLLFPHVLAELLNDRELIFAGLADRDLRKFGGHRVQALASLAAQYGERAINIIHAGGELLTCEAWQAAAMLLPPDQARARIAHLEAHANERAAWARQALGVASLAAYTVPRELFPKAESIIYNAIGGMDLGERDPALRQEVLARLADADAVGVRDRLTQAHLHGAGIGTRLMPDCAVMVAELFGEKIRAQTAAGAVAQIRQAFPQGYLAVQFSADFGDEKTLQVIAGQLDRIAASSGYGMVFFRAGAAPWHDELDCYARCVARMRTASPRIFTSLDLWDICALIAGSRAYMGSSLHGRIVAMAFGLPRLNLRDPAHPSGATKPSAFADTWEAPGMITTVGVHDIAEGLRDAIGVDPAVLAQSATRLVADYRSGFAALSAFLG